jgi:hypothetical protein
MGRCLQQQSSVCRHLARPKLDLAGMNISHEDCPGNCWTANATRHHCRLGDWGWEQTAGTEMGFHGWLAMILGIVFTIAIGCGLMGLMFYSSRYGYDERASDLSEKNKK